MICFPAGVSQITLPSQGIYRPEAYGTVTGTDPADGDLVQAAIDAAAAAGGGTVRLDNTYAYTDGTNHDGITEGKIGLYSATVRFWVNADNITIDGNGTGVLKITAMPTFTTGYITLLVGNGGFSGSALPGDQTWEWLEANGTWTRSVTVKNLAFDNSVLTDENLSTLSAASLGGSLLLAFCRDCEIDGITVDRAFRMGISTHCSSMENNLKNCTVSYAYLYGYWLDGLSDSVVDNLDALSFPNVSALETGFVIAVNADYKRGGENNRVTNINLVGPRTGMSISSPYSLIQDCTITLAGGSTTRVGIMLFPKNDNPSGVWWPHDVEITGCTVDRTGGSTNAIHGVKLIGINAAITDGQPRECSGNHIHHNTFPANTPAIALILDAQASHNVFEHNTIAATVSADTSGGTAHDNTIGPNP